MAKKDGAHYSHSPQCHPDFNPRIPSDLASTRSTDRILLRMA